MSSLACKSLISGGIVIVTVIFSSFAFVSLAHAYATPDSGTGLSLPFMGATPSEEAGWSGQSWSTISAPFESFLQSLQSAGQSVTTIPNGSMVTAATNLPAMPSFLGDAATEEAHDAFLKFDAWLAGIIGFHIAAVADVFLRFIDWTLGLAQAFISWLLTLVR